MTRRSSRYQFSLFTLMLLMLVAAVLGSVAARMRAASTTQVSGRVTFVFFTLLAPMLLMMALSTGRRLAALWAARSATAPTPTAPTAPTAASSQLERTDRRRLPPRS
jgi:hypothetical protein